MLSRSSQGSLHCSYHPDISLDWYPWCFSFLARSPKRIMQNPGGPCEVMAPILSLIFSAHAQKCCDPGRHLSETGRIRFRRVRFQTPNSVSFSALTEFWGANSVSSSQPIICVPNGLTEFFAELTEFAPKLSEAQ